MLYDALNIDIKLLEAQQLLTSSIAVRHLFPISSSVAFSIALEASPQQTQGTMTFDL